MQGQHQRKQELCGIGNLISNWGEVFAACSIPEKKVLLSKLIEQIDIKENDIRIKFKISMEEFGNSTDSHVPE